MSSTAEKATYENGMKELEEIITALEGGGIGVTATVAKCRRGKALEQALRKHLDECEGELKEIEQNENLPAIEIIDGGSGAADDAPAEAIDFETTSSADDSNGTDSNSQDDDIPF